MVHLILASQSPRRRQLITLLNYPITCTAAQVNEDSITDPKPTLNVIETARIKAKAISKQLDKNTANRDTWIISADTTVAVDDMMLNKPANANEAKQMLQTLRGRNHDVHTGIVLLNPHSGQQVADVHTAVVTMRDYTDGEIDTYIATGDPFDKAGAYAIQHPQFRPVSHLDGCFMGVMGLSICHLIQLMNQVNVPMLADLTAVSVAHTPYPPCRLWQQLQPYAKL